MLLHSYQIPASDEYGFIKNVFSIETNYKNVNCCVTQKSEEISEMVGRLQIEPTLTDNQKKSLCSLIQGYASLFVKYDNDRG